MVAAEEIGPNKALLDAMVTNHHSKFVNTSFIF